MNQTFFSKILKAVKFRIVLAQFKEQHSLGRIACRVVSERLPVLINSKYRIGLIIPIVYAAASAKKEIESLREAEKLIETSDEFFLLSKYKESYDILISLKNTNDPQVLWRLSRGLYNISQNADVTEEEKKNFIKEADEYIQKAIALNDQYFAIHKWRAIILDATTAFEGVKAKIASLPTFQFHILRAIELNPEDATSYHLMGVYHYGISDLPWYQKKIASALFGTVPPASFEEALTFFIKAEEVQPNFYSKNLLMIGKTYYKLGFQNSANEWLQRAANFEANSEEEKQVKKEATDLLKQLKQ